MNRPVFVGVTGVIGSGKSTVAHMFEELGAYRIDADKLAHKAIRKGGPAYAEIVREFGKEMLDKQGRIMKKRLKKITFDDFQKRKKLESIVHPRVMEEVINEVRKAERKGAKIVVFEVPLLFEVRLEKTFDFVITVVCELDTLKNRTSLRDRESLKDVEKVLAAQLPQEEKARRADFVINNSKSCENTLDQVKRVMNEILKRHELA